MIRDVYSHQSRIFSVVTFKHFLSLDPAARFEFMSLCWMGGAENLNFKLHRGVDILRVLLYMHVHRLGAAGVSIRPPSLKQTQRDLVAVDSRVSVLAGFACHSLTRPVDVCFLLGNNPSASVPDLQYSTEGYRRSLTAEM